MEAIYIHGGVALQGQVKVQGSKNAVLPILAATILSDGISVIENCPRLKDVYYMRTLLESLGCIVTWEGDAIRVDARKVDLYHVLCGMPMEAVRGMRSSIILLGAMLGRLKEAYLGYPGGCVIGKRPIDMHLEALEKMGVSFEEKNGLIHAYTRGLKGCEITLPMPSVGATENILMAAVFAEGKTVIHNAAKEPEIEALCEYLTGCGANISGIGTSTIVIEGTECLSGTRFRNPGDRIVAGTYLCACMAAGGEVLLQEAPTEHMEAQLLVARRMGAFCQESTEGLYVQMHGRPKAVEHLRTEPYPGFPTDMQSLFVSVLALSEGTCLIEENIFENRFHTVDDLNHMGACIEKLNENSIRVTGVDTLRGYPVEAMELRGGAALVVAGIAAKDVTIVDGCRYIERGYENICRDLRELGVRIYGA